MASKPMLADPGRKTPPLPTVLHWHDFLSILLPILTRLSDTQLHFALAVCCGGGTHALPFNCNLSRTGCGMGLSKTRSFSLSKPSISTLNSVVRELRTNTCVRVLKEDRSSLSLTSLPFSRQNITSKRSAARHHIHE